MTKEVFEAVKANNVELAEHLLKTVAEVDCCDEKGVTLLQFAADEGQEKMVALLLGAGADPNGEGEIARTPLHCAVSRGHTTVVMLLVAAGADIYKKNQYGYTPEDVARHKGRADLIQLLNSKREDLIKLLKTAHTKLSDSMALTMFPGVAASKKDNQKEVVRTAYCSIL